MIEKLTGAQEAAMPKYVEKWTAIGLSTEPSDNVKVRKAVNLTYECGGVPKPKAIISFDSPLAMLAAASFLMKRGELLEGLLLRACQDAVAVKNRIRSLGAKMGVEGWIVASDLINTVSPHESRVREGMIRGMCDLFIEHNVRIKHPKDYERILAEVNAESPSSLPAFNSTPVVHLEKGKVVTTGLPQDPRAHLYDYAANVLWGVCYDYLKDYIETQLSSKEQDEISALIRDNVGKCIYGNHDAGWLSFYDFFRTECKLEQETDKLLGLFELAYECGWCFPTSDFCFVSPRPCELHRDQPQGRLHNTEGAAVGYNDGWGVYSVHGVRVPEEIIKNPSCITVKMIDAENNAEVRRVMLDKFTQYDENGDILLEGTARYILESGLKAIDVKKDSIGHDVTLYQKPLRDDEPICMIHVKNPTPDTDGRHHEFWLRVPPTYEKNGKIVDLNDAEEARKWTLGLAGTDVEFLFEG